MNYNQAAMNLENVLCWWYSLTDKAKENQNEFEKLVESTEKIIQAETTGWVQEMRDALAELHEETTSEN